MDENKEHNVYMSIFVIGDELIKNDSLINYLKPYGCELIKSLDGHEIISQTENINNNNKSLVIIKDFDTDLFKKIMLNIQSILSSTLVDYLSKHNHPLPMIISRPIFNFSMKNLVICLAGFCDREEANELLNLIRYMGAGSRKDIKSKVTHLVALKASGAKYKSALLNNVQVMNVNWIRHSWEQRYDMSYDPSDPTIIEKFKLKPFAGLALAFSNFSQDDMKELTELTTKNGGIVVSENDDRCTHIVIDAIPGEEIDVDLNNLIKKNKYIVYKEWFWASLEMTERADESKTDHAFPVAGTKNFKRQNSEIKGLSNSRHSLDVLSPTIDFSKSFDNSIIENININNKANEEPTTPKIQVLTKRHAVCLELVQTERNYVEVLQTINNVFKQPLEERKYPENLLDATEIRIIFGNLTPIYHVHQLLLNDLINLMDNWKESCSIGSVFIKHSNALLKAYPPFVNYFENSKETIIECDDKYPRFHAFLKRCQSKPECKRQSLVELLIRPIQRLPSVNLLLSDILKNTEKSNSDYRQLVVAIDRIKEVLLHINEDKRKTEGQIAMFDIVNDIEDCPADLLSANRHFICKTDVKLLFKNESGKIMPIKGYTITLFLFTDVLEICKKRQLKRTHSLTNKNTSTKNNVPHSGGARQSCKKAYRHIESLELFHIKRVNHFKLSEGYENVFLLCSSLHNGRTFRFYPFIVNEKVDENSVNLNDFLDKLIKICLDEKLFEEGTMETLNLIDYEHAELLANGLSKSNLFMVKAREKVSRAFTIRRPPLSAATSTSSLYTPPNITNNNLRASPSPTPRRLSRAFSQFMNTLQNNSTLSRLQTATSLTEIPDENNDGGFSLPTTPAPRKKKFQNEDTISTKGT